MDLISIIVTFVCLVVLGLVTYWFVAKKNPTKISSREEIVEKNPAPQPGELEDPMNP
jgi:flagellar basal body-associated protein FliL